VDVTVYPLRTLPAVCSSVADDKVNAGAAIAVAGKTAVITPELALWVTDVAPATVKKLAVTPVSV
jgi:hypothetical protein